MIRNTFLILFFTVFCVKSSAQMPGFRPVNKSIMAIDSQKVSISINGSSFFKNNEYFNPIEEGYTLIGFYAEPTLKVQITDDFRMEGGIGLLKYSGKEGFYKTEPLFRVQYQPFTSFQVVIGNLYSGANHKIVEPLYQWERSFTNPSESGIQFLYNTRIVDADVWLNWEKFILPGDPFQEKLTVGIVTDWHLTGKNSDFSLSIPVQTLFRHQGGQINSMDTSLITLANWATGIRIRKNLNHSCIRFWEAEVYYLGYSDLSPKKQQQFNNGYGIYPKTKIGIWNFSAELGYFHGTRFISPMGERLFHSGTIPSSEIIFTNKDMLTGKLWFEKSITTGIMLGAYFESYTDLGNQKSDYSYGLHILFNQDFFLLKYK